MNFHFRDTRVGIDKLVIFCFVDTYPIFGCLALFQLPNFATFHVLQAKCEMLTGFIFDINNDKYLPLLVGAC